MDRAHDRPMAVVAQHHRDGVPADAVAVLAGGRIDIHALGWAAIV